MAGHRIPSVGTVFDDCINLRIGIGAESITGNCILPGPANLTVSSGCCCRGGLYAPSACQSEPGTASD